VSLVIQQRMKFQEPMREHFAQVIEQASGRLVAGFPSGNQKHPDLMRGFYPAAHRYARAREIAAIGRPSTTG